MEKKNEVLQVQGTSRRGRTKTWNEEVKTSVLDYKAT